MFDLYTTALMYTESALVRSIEFSV